MPGERCQGGQLLAPLPHTCVAGRPLLSRCCCLRRLAWALIVASASQACAAQTSQHHPHVHLAPPPKRPPPYDPQTPCTPPCSPSCSDALEACSLCASQEERQECLSIFGLDAGQVDTHFSAVFALEQALAHDTGAPPHSAPAGQRGAEPQRGAQRAPPGCPEGFVRLAE